MRVCYFGSFDSKEPRNHIIRKGLVKSGVEIVDCNDKSFLPIRFFKLFAKFFRIRDKDTVDAVIVGFPGWGDVFIAKPLCFLFNKLLVYDAFMSVYDTLVMDRKVVKQGSLKAKLLHLADKWACKLADVIFLDTKVHCTFFMRKFGVSPKKLCVIPIGADEELFKPSDKKSFWTKEFVVGFHGQFIPLQGIRHILEAAKLVDLKGYDDIRFKIIGDGQTFKEMWSLNIDLGNCNVEFIGWVEPEKIPEYIANFDVGLGIFGSTEKAERVFPHKAYEIMAMRKPLITMGSDAAKEFVNDREHCLFCEPHDGIGLSNAVIELHNNPGLAELIADGGYKLFLEKYTTKKVGEKVVAEVMALKSEVVRVV